MFDRTGIINILSDFGIRAHTLLNAWQKGTPLKMPDNRQVLDNLEAYVQDRLNITKSLIDKA